MEYQGKSLIGHAVSGLAKLPQGARRVFVRVSLVVQLLGQTESRPEQALMLSFASVHPVELSISNWLPQPVEPEGKPKLQ